MIFSDTAIIEINLVGKIKNALKLNEQNKMICPVTF